MLLRVRLKKLQESLGPQHPHNLFLFQIVSMYLKLIILIFLAFMLDSTWSHDISIGNIRPDLILLVLVYTALRMGSLTGTLLGFSIGLLEDFNGSPGNMGLNALCNSIIGHIVGMARKTIYRDSLSTLSLTLILSGLAHSIIYWFIYTRFEVFETTYYLGTIAIPTIIYTYMVGLILIVCFTMKHRKLDVRSIFPE